MINLRYKKIYLLQFFLFIIFGGINFVLLKSDFIAHNQNLFIIFWIISTLLFILNLKLFLLPSNSFFENIDELKEAQELNWPKIEEVVKQKNNEFKSISAHFETENHKYKTILDSLHDPICIINKKQQLLYVNNSFCTLFAIHNPSSELRIIEVTRNLFFHEFITHAIFTSKVEILRDFSFDSINDANKKFYKIKIFPIDKTENFLCVMHDVSERIFTDKVREEFVANFSHEVRTPLTIIDTQLQSFKQDIEFDQNLKDKYHETLTTLSRNLYRLNTLFNNLLRLSSIEKLSSVTKEPIYLEMIVTDIFNEIKTKYPNKQIELKLELLKEMIFVDYNQFEHVFLNLIDNAFKYSRTTGTILIKSHTIDNKDVIEIIDDGIGIPETHLVRVFERFYRVDPSRSNKIDGNGLGLAITKHIIQKHSGKIFVKSELNKGAQFIITLPTHH